MRSAFASGAQIFRHGFTPHEELTRSTVRSSVELGRRRRRDARQICLARRERTALERLDRALKVSRLLTHRSERVPNVRTLRKSFTQTFEPLCRRFDVAVELERHGKGVLESQLPRIRLETGAQDVQLPTVRNVISTSARHDASSV